MDDEYLRNLGDPTAAYGGMPNYTINDPLGGDIPSVDIPSSLGDPTGGYGGMPNYTINDPLGGDMPPVNPPDAVDPNDPLGGGTPPKTDTPQIPTDLKNLLRGLIVGADGKVNPMGALGIAALLSTLGLGRSTSAPVGYQGGIPRYTAVRQQVPMPVDPNRRPGSAGRRYFTDVQYVPESKKEDGIAAAKTLAQKQAEALKPAMTQAPADKKLIEDNVKIGPSPAPASDVIKLSPVPKYDAYGKVIPAAQGGLMNLAQGRYLNGSTDGMADKIPANIDGKQEARLSHGEFVIPADVVSHLGNGNSEAGAQELYSMMDRIRKARTGNPKQGKQIAPSKYLPS